MPMMLQLQGRGVEVPGAAGVSDPEVARTRARAGATVLGEREMIIACKA